MCQNPHLADLEDFRPNSVSILFLPAQLSSQNYRSQLNACIDRAECGTTAYFYTDSYTKNKALIEES